MWESRLNLEADKKLPFGPPDLLLHLDTLWIADHNFWYTTVFGNFPRDTDLFVSVLFLGRTEFVPILSPYQDSEDLTGIRFVEIEKRRLSSGR